jgi:hypothetical protein
MSKIYIVQTNECGTIGAFTTVTKAFDAAFGYLGETYEGKWIEQASSSPEEKLIKATVSNLQKELKTRSNVTMKTKDTKRFADIRAFTANYNHYIN